MESSALMQTPIYTQQSCTFIVMELVFLSAFFIFFFVRGKSDQQHHLHCVTGHLHRAEAFLNYSVVGHFLNLTIKSSLLTQPVFSCVSWSWGDKMALDESSSNTIVSSTKPIWMSLKTVNARHAWFHQMTAHGCHQLGNMKIWTIHSIVVETFQSGRLHRKCWAIIVIPTMCTIKTMKLSKFISKAITVSSNHFRPRFLSNCGTKIR